MWKTATPRARAASRSIASRPMPDRPMIRTDGASPAIDSAGIEWIEISTASASALKSATDSGPPNGRLTNREPPALVFGVDRRLLPHPLGNHDDRRRHVAASGGDGGCRGRAGSKRATDRPLDIAFARDQRGEQDRAVGDGGVGRPDPHDRRAEDVEQRLRDRRRDLRSDAEEARRLADDHDPARPPDRRLDEIEIERHHASAGR